MCFGLRFAALLAGFTLYTAAEASMWSWVLAEALFLGVIAFMAEMEAD